MDTSDLLFFGIFSGILGWLGFWSFVGKVLKDVYPNAPPGSRGKRLINAAEFISIIPLLPTVPFFIIWILGVKRPLERFQSRRRGKKEVLKLRRRWEGHRRQWATDDLEHARREKEPVLGPEDSISEETQLAPPAAQIFEPKPSVGLPNLESLPAELRIQIYTYLDYGMALRLSCVSRFLKNDQPHESIDREQRATFVYHADTFPHNRKAGRLACFSCLRLRDKDEFSEEFRTGGFKRYGFMDIERKCFDCQVVRGEIAWTRIFGRKMGRWETRLWNRLVRLVKSEPSGGE